MFEAARRAALVVVVVTASHSTSLAGANSSILCSRNPAIEVNWVEPDLPGDPVVGDHVVFCRSLKNCRGDPQLLAGGDDVDKNDQVVAAVSSSDARTVIDPPEL